MFAIHRIAGLGINTAAFKWLAIGLTVAALLGAVHVNGHRSGAAGVQQKWDVERKHLAFVALQASEAAREEEQRRFAAQQEIRRDAQLQVDSARADAAAARAAGGQLRDQLAAFRRAAGNNPAAAAGGQAAGDPIGVLADVLGRADERAGELAAYADAARIAGAACERAYDALNAQRLVTSAAPSP